MTQKTKKNSAAKKLVPAAGMLAVSAMMLASSTYAWFTMAREVEVKNIQMTATVPEDIQISLGHLQYVAGGTNNVTIDNAKDHTGLAGNEGILTGANSGSADDGNVQAPETGVDAVSMLDWSSTADISAYYRLGKIIPASSTTGENIYFTPDASGVGKTLKTGAGYFAAALGLTAQKEDRTGNTGDDATTYKTKLHAITTVDEAADKWNDGTASQEGYTTASGWNQTEDDGYYVDIPVWLRTSSTDGATLAVDAYVTADTAVDDDDLYLAARAAILPDGNDKFGKEETPAETTSGLIEVRKDSWEGTSIVDFLTSTNNDGEAVQSLTENAATLGGKTATYGTDTHYNGDNLIKLAGKAAGANGYGTARKVWIRVWLEGEDPNCWNQNAGQNFNICLKFTRDAINPAVASNPFVNTTGENPSLNTNALVKGETTTVKFMAGETVSNTLTYVYDGTAWQWQSGTYHAPANSKAYKVGNTEISATDAASRAYFDSLVTNTVTDATKLVAGVTINIVDAT